MLEPREESFTLSRQTIAYIQQAAERGLYDIRGLGAKRQLPTFDDLVFLTASLSRYPLEGYRERCATDVVLGTRFAKKPIGTGPYMFVEWVKDDHLTLEANPNYWDSSYKGKPQVKTVILRPVPDAATRLADLRSGAADMIMDVPSDQVAGLKSEQVNIHSEYMGGGFGRRGSVDYVDSERVTYWSRGYQIDAMQIDGLTVISSGSIFIQPESVEELERRLRLRGTEAEEAVQRRLAVARRELAVADRYHHQVVNVAR